MISNDQIPYKHVAKNWISNLYPNSTIKTLNIYIYIYIYAYVIGKNDCTRRTLVISTPALTSFYYYGAESHFWVFWSPIAFQLPPLTMAIKQTKKTSLGIKHRVYMCVLFGDI